MVKTKLTELLVGDETNEVDPPVCCNLQAVLFVGHHDSQWECRNCDATIRVTHHGIVTRPLVRTRGAK